MGATHVVDRHLSTAGIAAQAHSIAAGRKEGITHIYGYVSWSFELAVEILAVEKGSKLLALHPVDGDFLAFVKGRRLRCEAKFVVGTTAGMGELAKGVLGKSAWLGRAGRAGGRWCEDY